MDRNLGRLPAKEAPDSSFCVINNILGTKSNIIALRLRTADWKHRYGLSYRSCFDRDSINCSNSRQLIGSSFSSQPGQTSNTVAFISGFELTPYR